MAGSILKVVRVAVISALVLLPGVLFTVFVATFHEDELVWEIWLVPAWIASCCLAGLLSSWRFNVDQLQQAYKDSVAPAMETVFVLVGVTLGIAALVVGLASFLHPHALLEGD